MNARDVTIVIPTYNRGAILVDTIEVLLQQKPRAAAMIIADQTVYHSVTTEKRLREWDVAGCIRWMRFSQPSITRSMNEALLAARTPLTLFLDDDIDPPATLVAAHADAHDDPAIWAVVGQILQPTENPAHYPRHNDDLEFRFNHDERCLVSNVMAGNLSVRRDRALDIGGFDENFIGAAYRFETDFALRVVDAGGLIRFEPRATLRHLKLSSGGLRSFGDHKTAASPAHTMGDYYFAFLHRRPVWRYAARRMRANILTRFHATHPWTIPSKIIGELRGLLMARRLARGGRQLRHTATIGR